MFACVQPSISSHLFVCCGVNPLGNMATPFSSLCAFFSALDLSPCSQGILFSMAVSHLEAAYTHWWMKRATHSSDSLQPFPLLLKDIHYDQPSSAGTDLFILFYLFTDFTDFYPDSELASTSSAHSVRQRRQWQGWDVALGIQHPPARAGTVAAARQGKKKY